MSADLIATTPLPNWLKDEILRGLQRLLLLRKEGAPSEDTVVGTAAAWMEFIGYHRRWTDDEDRSLQVHAAFMALAGEKRWPQPGDLLRALDGQPDTITVDRLTFEKAVDRRAGQKAIAELIANTALRDIIDEHRASKDADAKRIVPATPEQRRRALGRRGIEELFWIEMGRYAARVRNDAAGNRYL